MTERYCDLGLNVAFLQRCKMRSTMPRIVQSILLVEPEGILAEITAFRLELLGYRVEVVATAEAARKAVCNQRPDLIITDLVLEGTSSLSLVETLTSGEETQSIPIMVLSLDA